ncbi:MAG: hypothetical protein IKD91_04740 [Clostridiales bacterium]|nr:hypothetical protein [Clostridiales bacterium]
MDFLTGRIPQATTGAWKPRSLYAGSAVPVWINTFAYDGRNYIIVINGQTGKINGQWPKSFGTLMKKAVELFF